MKKFLKFLSIALLLFFATSTYAIEIGTAGDIVNQTGEYSSTRFAAGNKVNNTAVVDGLSFVAGNELTLNGKAPYGFYAGNVLNVNEDIEKDMFVAGNHITIGSDAKVGRDAYIAGSTVVINSNIGRDLRVGAQSVDLSNVTISGDAYVYADEIILNENTNITGVLEYESDTRVSGLDKATIGSVKKIEVEASVEIRRTFEDKIVDFLLSTIAAFITMAALFYIMPNVNKKLDKFKLKFDEIAKTSCIGLVVLIAIPVISIIAMITRVLIPLALIVLAIYAVSMYLSFLLSYYIVGKAVAEKLLKNKNVYVAIIIGIVLVKLVGLIPYIGGFITFIALIFGLGLIYNFIKNIREK